MGKCFFHTSLVFACSLSGVRWPQELVLSWQTMPTSKSLPFCGLVYFLEAMTCFISLGFKALENAVKILFGCFICLFSYFLINAQEKRSSLKGPAGFHSMFSPFSASFPS